MAKIHKGGLLLIFISLLILEFLLFSFAEDSKEILLSRNFSCDSVFSLSSQTDSYKIIFPQESDSTLCECSASDCSGRPPKWVCRINFEVDAFTLSAYELCIDPSHQEIRHCGDHPSRSSAMIFSGDDGLMFQLCSLKPHMKCLGKERKFRQVYLEYIPCSFDGFSHIYLKRRHAPTYVLFKENRSCRPDVLEAASGKVVSEFDHRIQNKSHFCPLMIRARKRREYTKFCIWVEFASFYNMCSLSIVFSSVDGESVLIFNRTQVRETGYCEDPRPEGYIISAVVDVNDSFNDHRFRLGYAFTEKVKVDSHETDERNEDDNDDHDNINIWVILAPIVAFVIIGIIGMWGYHKYNSTLTGRRNREFSGPPDRPSIPLNSPTTSSPTPTTTINTRLASQEENLIGPQISSSVEPSAPMMEESRFVDDAPPSYDSLFKTGV